MTVDPLSARRRRARRAFFEGTIGGLDDIFGGAGGEVWKASHPGICTRNGEMGKKSKKSKSEAFWTVTPFYRDKPVSVVMLRRASMLERSPQLFSRQAL